MTGGHGVGGLHHEGDTRLHRASATVKLVAALWFVVAVVLTDPRSVAAFAAYALLVAVAVGAARIPLRTLGRRLLIEAPFVVFAVLLPFVGQGERVEVLGLSLSVAGLWGAWGILAKGTLGLAVSIVLGWTTPVADLLDALERLRVPRVLVLIAGFMVRYLEVLTGELRRLEVARVSRGDDPRWPWQGKAVALTAGALFVRSFERGERVQTAMQARGFTGEVPRSRRAPLPPADLWLLAWPLLASVVCATAWVATR